MGLAPQARPRWITETGHRVCVVCPVLAPDAACLHPGLFFARLRKAGYDKEAAEVVNRLLSLIAALRRRCTDERATVARCSVMSREFAPRWRNGLEKPFSGDASIFALSSFDPSRSAHPDQPKGGARRIPTGYLLPKGAGVEFIPENGSIAGARLSIRMLGKWFVSRSAASLAK
jgi:hypothetical protein